MTRAWARAASRLRIRRSTAVRGRGENAGIAPREVSDDEIRDRLLRALVERGKQLVADGVALRSGDIDIVYVYGYGFPPHRGGPMWYAAIGHAGQMAPGRMREAAIVSAARTPIGRAFRGAFNQTPGATLAGHVVRAAVERAGLDPADVDDVIMGCGLPEGATGNNVGRTAALRAGCPVSVPGQTISRFCASGLDAIAAGAKRVIADGANAIVAGGVESISMVQNVLNMHFLTEDWLLRHAPDLYTPMLFTADYVAKRYGVSRERQDEYALQSQQRTAAAQQAGRFDAEIVPLPTWKVEQSRETGAVSERHVVLERDEGNRPDTTLAGLAALKSAVPGVADTSMTAGNSSQLSDGAAAVAIVDRDLQNGAT